MQDNQEVCEACGVRKLGGKCLTKTCEKRANIVDQVLEDLHQGEIR